MLTLSSSRTDRTAQIWPAHAAFDAKPDTTSQLSPLIERLTSETHHVMALTAVAASGMNAISESGVRAWPDGLMTYATPDLSLIQQLIALAKQNSHNQCDFEELNVFLLSHLEGRQALEWYAAEAGVLGAGRAMIVHRHNLKRAWQHACRQAVFALHEIEEATVLALPDLYLQNNRVLSGLLNSAANGFKPCISQDNELIMPPLPQQRRWPRQSLLQNCVVTFGGKSRSAFVRDVSAGGLGLDRMPTVLPGQLISVELESGRMLTGTIAWCQDRSAGMTFGKALLPSDPLICW